VALPSVVTTADRPRAVEGDTLTTIPRDGLVAPIVTVGGTDGCVTSQVVNGLRITWLTFSSSRAMVSTGKKQLYVAGVVRNSATGDVTTYARIYLWNQDETFDNLIPAWAEFAIPPGTTPPPPPPGQGPPK
jgi:hypothetical protein